MSTWPVTHSYGSYLNLSPIIEMHNPRLKFIDYGTDVRMVRFSELNRSPWQPLIKQEHMARWYSALREFNRILYSRERQAETLSLPIMLTPQSKNFDSFVKRCKIFESTMENLIETYMNFRKI